MMTFLFGSISSINKLLVREIRSQLSEYESPRRFGIILVGVVTSGGIDVAVVVVVVFGILIIFFMVLMVGIRCCCKLSPCCCC